MRVALVTFILSALLKNNNTLIDRKYFIFDNRISELDE
jgi:hypothetical protein